MQAFFLLCTHSYLKEYINNDYVKYYYESEGVLMDGVVNISENDDQEIKAIFKYLLDNGVITEDEYRKAVAKIKS